MQNAIFHAFFYRIKTPLNSQILLEISFSPICKNELFDVLTHFFMRNLMHFSMLETT